MSMKINKNGKEFPVGVIPQNVIDDVAKLKDWIDIKADLTNVSVTAGANYSFYIGVKPSGYMIVGSYYVRIDGTNDLSVGSPLVQTGTGNITATIHSGATSTISGEYHVILRKIIS